MPAEHEFYWRSIVLDITAQIERGELQPGQKLPSIAQLVAKYEVSTTVVWRAINHLKAAGVLYGWQGRGVFVAERPPDVSS